jgi:hypothetical protein
MPLTCTVSDPNGINPGDAVCVIGFDDVTYPTRPILVAQASQANLATSKTVYGISRETATKTTGNAILLNLAGEVVEAAIAAGLAAGAGAGTSHVIATDINAASGLPADQCRLIRADRPNGSEHVVGTCDENGNLAVQPRASRDTSAQHVFNVCSYGALSDGRRFDDGYIDDGVFSGNATTLYSATANFTSPDDIGKKIQIPGAGAAGTTLTTTITPLVEVARRPLSARARVRRRS